MLRDRYDFNFFKISRFMKMFHRFSFLRKVFLVVRKAHSYEVTKELFTWHYITTKKKVFSSVFCVLLDFSTITSQHREIHVVSYVWNRNLIINYLHFYLFVQGDHTLNTILIHCRDNLLLLNTGNVMHSSLYIRSYSHYFLMKIMDWELFFWKFSIIHIF